MALRFISHKEIAFRQLLSMLRTPPIAVMGYYSNLFLSARFVFGEQPDKIQYMDKEIRRVECMVGVWPTSDSQQIQNTLRELGQIKRKLEQELQSLETYYESAGEKGREILQQLADQIMSEMAMVDRREHILLFKLQPLMNLKLIEIYMDNNMDLKSFFKEAGRLVTQMELNAELDKVKIWIYQEAVQQMPYVRFTKLE
jgi:hypothetical protein